MSNAVNYFIEPEVSGQLGEKTVLDTSIHPPIVKRLHFVFYGWLGDDIIECFPVFLITEKLKSSLQEAGLTGYQISNCEIELSEEFEMLQPETILPNFYWFKVTGKDQDDFKIYKNKLTVSDFAYSILNQFNLKNAVIEISE
jgi:hypothetical protein